MSLWTRRDHYAHVPYYKGEPMEEAMRDYETYPPMTVWNDSLKYILATVGGRVFPWRRPTERQLERIHRELLGYACEHYTATEELKQGLDGVNTLWPKLYEKLEDNAGLVKLMNNYGAKSWAFAQFPATLVPRAIALDSSFGNNYDNAGTYCCLMGDHASCWSGAVTPVLVELRRRAYFAKSTIFQQFSELVNYANHPAPQKLGRVITAGGGLLVEFRKYGWTLSQIQSLDIIACDMDETLLKELDVVFMHDFGVPFSETGIQYRHCTIEEMLADESLYGTAKVFLIDGVLSYCRDKQQMLAYVAGAKNCLTPDGCILCDWQIMEISLLLCVLVHCWVSTMKPELFPWMAVWKAKWIARKLGLRVEYQVDPRNPRPLGVIARYWVE